MIPMRELVSHSIGGGWGEEIHTDGTEQVAIIRGADFPEVAVGDTSAIPHRWESTRKIPQRTLQPGDIVLESSGGTSDRPTGRTVFISEQLLDRFDVPVIPASFCRLVRIDPSMADPHYVYWWLQGMYTDGRTWGYQNRSTGIANFQFQHFLDAEKVSLPTPDEQRAIAATLGALDDKIESNRRTSRLLLSLAEELFAQSIEHKVLSSIPFDDVVHRLQVKHKHSGKSVAPSGRTIVLDQGRSGTLGYHDGDPEFMGTPDSPICLFGDHTCTWRLGLGAFDVGPNVIPVVAKEDSPVDSLWMFFGLRGVQKFQEYRRHWMEFKLHEVPWVDEITQSSFVSVARPMVAMIHELEAQSKRLSEVRDALLPELLSGRIRVPGEGTDE